MRRGCGSRRFSTDSLKLVSESTTHVALAVVLQAREGRLEVLLWERAKEPELGAWALPGGDLGAGETLEDSIRRHLAAKVDVRELAHVEQLETRSDPRRYPRGAPARDRVPRPRPRSGATRPSPTTRVGTRWKTFRAWRSTTARSRTRRASGCARSSRTRTSASRSRPTCSRSPSCARSTRPRSDTTCPRRTCSACFSGAGCSCRPGSAASPGRAEDGRPRSSASAPAELEVTDPFAVLRPPAAV